MTTSALPCAPELEDPPERAGLGPPARTAPRSASFVVGTVKCIALADSCCSSDDEDQDDGGAGEGPGCGPAGGVAATSQAGHQPGHSGSLSDCRVGVGSNSPPPLGAGFLTRSGIAMSSSPSLLSGMSAPPEGTAQEIVESRAGDLITINNGRDKLPRTLSTSVLRIKHRATFWDRLWQEKRTREVFV